LLFLPPQVSIAPIGTRGEGTVRSKNEVLDVLLDGGFLKAPKNEVPRKQAVEPASERRDMELRRIGTVGRPEKA
jgi:hypothetical protein